MSAAAHGQGQALGLIEALGLAGILEAADTAAKAADVQLLGIERIGGGLVSLRLRGDTASVQTAVRAAREAARRITDSVRAHVIPAPQLDVESMLSGGAPGGAPGAAPDNPSAAVTDADLASLPVARLRQLARQTPGVALRGREVSRANKQQLLEALRAAGSTTSQQE